MPRRRLALIVASCVLAAGAAPGPGHHPRVAVSGPTRLDWAFAVGTQSLKSPPAELLGADYDSTKQSYDLFVPARKSAKGAFGAVLYISAGNEPGGVKAFEGACQSLGLVFIGVRDAGNDVPSPRRVRIVLDCLDDVRRQLPLDPDRTYVSGLSGGARIACGIAFALPEQFGGLLPVCAGGDMRAEPWLRHRIAGRLSAALVTGQNDFNRGEVERWKGPYWEALGVRTRVWVRPGMGHTLPPEATILEALKWLEEGKERRAEYARKSPTSRAADKPPSREEAAQALFDEGKKGLSSPASLHRSLMLLKGVYERWPDAKAGVAARQLLGEYEKKPARPWEKDDLDEQKAQIAAEARSLGDYALNGVPKGSPYEKARPLMARRAVELWSVLIQDDPDAAVSKEGRKQVELLKALAEKGK